MAKLRLFTANYVERYDLLIIELAWENEYYPSHHVRITPELIEIMAEDWETTDKIEGNFSDLVVHADNLDVLRIVQLLSKYIAELEF